MSNVLSIQHISKSYGPIQALKDVSFDVPEGSVYGILGPNGSGKTTLLGIVLDVLVANSGNYDWFGGVQKDAARKQIGSLLETPNFYHYLDAEDNLAITAGLRGHGKEDIERVLRQVRLFERKNSKFQTYSLGMKQRLAIAAALLGGPKLLVFDEPTNGLDPSGIAEIRELILQLNAQGITIIIASHLLDEIEKVCTHVAILKRGNLLLNGPVGEVLVNEDQIEVAAAELDKLKAIVQQMPGLLKTGSNDRMLQLTCLPDVAPEFVNAYCFQNGIALTHLAVKKKSLESKFMELTK